MRVAVKHCEHGDNEACGHTGALTDSAMQLPSTSTESAIPISTGGSGTTNIPMMAPTTIIAGKTTGKT